MLVNESESTIISSLGWVDRGNLWVLSAATDKVEHIPISDARGMQLFPGTHGHFAIQHSWGDDWDKMDRIELTAHSFRSPATIIAKIVIKPDHETFDGDSIVWNELPHVYVAPMKGHYYLFVIDASKRKVERQQLGWFEKQYDTDYQSIGPALQVPKSDFVLLPIQRSSTPLLYDLKTEKVVRGIELGAGKSGTPKLSFSNDGATLWAMDYDTLLKLDTSNWKVLWNMRLQEGDATASMKFAGDPTFAQHGEVCVVARPFSSDIAIIDTIKLKVIDHVKVGSQPLEAVLLKNGKIYARDWQSGNLLMGTYSCKLNPH